MGTSDDLRRQDLKKRVERLGAESREEAEQYAKKADYYWAVVRKYERAARYPWLPVEPTPGAVSFTARPECLLRPIPSRVPGEDTCIQCAGTDRCRAGDRRLAGFDCAKRAYLARGGGGD